MAILSLKNTLLSAILLLSTSHPVSAQDTFSFLPSAASSTFPACGLSCQLLLEAQSGCVPPQAAVSNADTYVSCFCQSSLISGLPYTASMCPTCTTTSDQQLLITWYKDYCAGGFRSTLTTSATVTTSSATSTTGLDTASATSTFSPSRKASSSSSDNTTSNNSKSWFSTHWRWVLMLIILVIGFSALAAAAVWLKKRLDAKQPNLYHGDDRNNGGGSGGSPSPAAAFFAGSLRNLSRSNVNSTRASTNNSSNNVAVASKVTKMQQQPSMSTTSFSNRRSSTLTNSVMSNSNSNMNSNGHEMWGPNQARNFENVAPVEEPVFRNSIASAAAAAAFGGGAAGTAAVSDPELIGIASTTANNSRTDLSSVSTGGGRATPRNFNRSSVQSTSASNLHQPQRLHQQSTPLLREAQSERELQRPKSANPVSPIHD